MRVIQALKLKISTLKSHLDSEGEPTKLGTYSGNKTIDITGLEDRQFFFSNISATVCSHRMLAMNSSGAPEWITVTFNGLNLGLSKSGSTLTVSGAVIPVKDSGSYTASDSKHSSSSNITYDIYYV